MRSIKLILWFVTFQTPAPVHGNGFDLGQLLSNFAAGLTNQGPPPSASEQPQDNLNKSTEAFPALDATIETAFSEIQAGLQSLFDTFTGGNHELRPTEEHATDTSEFGTLVTGTDLVSDAGSSGMGNGDPILQFISAITSTFSGYFQRQHNTAGTEIADTFTHIVDGLNKFVTDNNLTSTPAQVPVAGSQENLIAQVLSTFVRSAASSDDVKNIPMMPNILNAMANLIGELGAGGKDPFAALLGQLTHVASEVLNNVPAILQNLVNQILGGAQESFGSANTLKSRAFSSPPATNGLVAFAQTVANALKTALDSVKGLLGNTFSMSTEALDYQFAGLESALDRLPVIVANVTSIGTSEQGIEAIFDVVSQILVSAVTVVDEGVRVTTNMTDTMMGNLNYTVFNGVDFADQHLTGWVRGVLNQLFGGVWSSCAAPIESTMLGFAMGMHDVLDKCVQNEFDNAVGMLKSTSSALLMTNEIVQHMQDNFIHCPTFQLIPCGVAVWNTVQSIGKAWGAFAAISTSFASMSAMHISLPACMGTHSLDVVFQTGLTATNILTCFF